MCRAHSHNTLFAGNVWCIRAPNSIAESSNIKRGWSLTIPFTYCCYNIQSVTIFTAKVHMYNYFKNYRHRSTRNHCRSDTCRLTRVAPNMFRQIITICIKKWYVECRTPSWCSVTEVRIRCAVGTTHIQLRRWRRRWFSCQFVSSKVERSLFSQHACQHYKLRNTYAVLHNFIAQHRWFRWKDDRTIARRMQLLWPFQVSPHIRSSAVTITITIYCWGILWRKMLT